MAYGPQEYLATLLTVLAGVWAVRHDHPYWAAWGWAWALFWIVRFAIDAEAHS